MKFVKVESSQISRIGFEFTLADTHGTLVVVFHDKNRVETSAYRFRDVPANYVVRMVYSKSTGSTFDQLIKKGGFAYDKLPEIPALEGVAA